jgi:hypothetical protein
MQAEDRNPLHHTQNMQHQLREMIEDLRSDIEKVDEAQLKAMFETAAEVLGGLAKAFRDYEEKNEPAWRQSEPDPKTTTDERQHSNRTSDSLKREGDPLPAAARIIAGKTVVEDEP